MLKEVEDMFQIILEAIRLAAHAAGPAAQVSKAPRPLAAGLRHPRLG